MTKSAIAKYLADIGKKGGLNRARKLSKRERAAIARKGGLAKVANSKQAEREREARYNRWEQFRRERIPNLEPDEAFRKLTRLEEYTPTAKRDLRKILRALTKDSPDTVSANWDALKLKEISGCWLGDITVWLFEIGEAAKHPPDTRLS